MMRIILLSLFLLFSSSKTLASIYNNVSSDPDFSAIFEEGKIKNIIFDLNGVMFKSNSLRAMQKIGLKTTLSYLFRHGLPCTDDLFKMLKDMPAKNQDHCVIHNGAPLPPILVDWQLGLETNAVILREVENFIDSQVISRTKKILYKRIMSFMLSPKDLIDTIDPIVESHRLLKSVRLYQRDIKVFALSNWDKESFPELEKRYPHFFRLLNGYVISSQVGCTKPSIDIFQALIDKYHIVPEETLFIDDEKANVQAAQKMGLKSLHIRDLPCWISYLKSMGLWERSL